MEQSDPDRTDAVSDTHLEAAIRDHYGESDLDNHIVSAFEQAGKDVDDLERDEIASFDEFHIRGQAATRELAELVPIQSGDRVIDIGCGVGGAARTLAMDFEADVVGVDVVDEYIRTANRFNDRVGLGEHIRFEQANALDLPFDDGTFDVAWFQHTLMNIPTAAQAIGEPSRVLRPDGALALYEICAGPGGQPYFPVPWAPDDSLNFLLPPDELRDTVTAADFEERTWRDVSSESLEWFRDVVAALRSRPADAPPALGINLLMGAETPSKVTNVVRSLEEERIRVVMGVFERVG